MFRRLLSLFSGSRRSSPAPASVPQPGDLWSVATDDGQYGMVKILASDLLGVHVRLYVQRFNERPGPADPRELTLAAFAPEHVNPFSIGHMPLSHQTFRNWEPEFVARGAVAQDELEGYHTWLEANGGYF